MRKGHDKAVLTLDDSEAEMTLWTSGSAVLDYEAGTVTFEALIEAEDAWINLGGTAEQFDEAVSYVDSIR